MAIKRFIKKPSVPSLTGWPDWAHGVMNPIKQTLEIITGRRGEKLEQLSGEVELDAVAEKINEVIRVLQDGQDVDVSGAASVAPTPQVTVNNITQTVIQELGTSVDLGWRKNMIMNPAFRFWTWKAPGTAGSVTNWQEGIDLGGSFGDSTTNGAIADMWFIHQNSNATSTRFTYWRAQGSELSALSSMPPVRHAFAVRTNATTGNTASQKRIRAAIPYNRYAQILGKPTTLSFWVRSPVTGTITVALTILNRGIWCRKAVVVNAINTWEKKVVFFETTPLTTQEFVYRGANANGWRDCVIELFLTSNLTSSNPGAAVAGYPGWTSVVSDAEPGQINLCAVSTFSPSFMVTAFQLEVGQEATEFIDPPDDDELASIQHFIEKSCGIDEYVAAGSTTYTGATQVGQVYSGPGTYRELWPVQFRVPKLFGMKYGYEWASPGGWSIISRTKIINGIEPSRRVGLSFSGQANSPVGGAVLLDVEVGASGTVTSATSTTLTDNTKSWPTNHLRNLVVTITGGTGAGQSRTISSHTGTTLTLSTAWTTTPDTTSTYTVADDSRTALHWIAGVYLS